MHRLWRMHGRVYGRESHGFQHPEGSDAHEKRGNQGCKRAITEMYVVWKMHARLPERCRDPQDDFRDAQLHQGTK